MAVIVHDLHLSARGVRVSARFLVAAVAVGAVAAGCGDEQPRYVRGRPGIANAEIIERAAPDSAIHFDYQKLPVTPPSRHALLRLVRSVRLGHDSSDTPISIREARAIPGGFVVLDDLGRRLYGFEPDGRVRFVAGRWGEGEGQLSDPVDIEVRNDTIFLLDLSHRNHLTLYSREGRYLGKRNISLDEGGAFLAVTSRGLIFATLVSRPKNGIRYAMAATDNNGRFVWRGCESDPRYMTSETSGGMLRAYAFRGVVAAGGRVYCWQPITPVVQVYTLQGAFVGALRRAPPFYLSPQDTAASSNVREMERFEARWTSHLRFYPISKGFASVYTDWDLSRAQERYRLFACDSTNGSTECQSGLLPGRPVGIQGDTLMVMRATRPAGELFLEYLVIDIGS